MTRIFFLLLIITVASTAGAGVIIALVLGYYSFQGIALGVLIGGALGIPLAWYVAKRIDKAEIRGDDVL